MSHTFHAPLTSHSPHSSGLWSLTWRPAVRAHLIPRFLEDLLECARCSCVRRHVTVLLFPLNPPLFIRRNAGQRRVSSPPSPPECPTRSGNLEGTSGQVRARLLHSGARSHTAFFLPAQGSDNSFRKFTCQGSREASDNPQRKR